MPKFLQNTLALLVLWVVVLGVGIYVTYMRQPQKLERVEGAVKVERMKQAKVTSLLEEVAATRSHAREAVNKWQARYKVIPDTISSPAVVGQLNDLTRSGFENFDITFRGINRTPDYSFLSYAIQGRGYFSSLYDFVWEVENSRKLYRLSDLRLNHIDLITEDRESGKKRMEVMVSFEMELKAYFGGVEGMSAPDAQLASLTGQELEDQQPPPIPEEVLPEKKPAVNPFFPGILDQLPPNTNNLVDVEKAKLISIVDGKAVFKYGEEFRALGEGDPVYLGQVTVVDPKENRVVAQLNKGGILDRVERTLGEEANRYRQAQGPNRLSPTENE